MNETNPLKQGGQKPFEASDLRDAGLMLSWKRAGWLTQIGTVSLQPVCPHSDARKLFEWRADPNVARYMYSRQPLRWDSHVEWLDSQQSNPTRIDFIISLDERPVGSVNLACIDWDHRRCDFGMYVAEPKALLRGVGVAAEWLLLNIAFEQLQLHKVSCEVMESNRSPIALHRRFGFCDEGVFRDHVSTDGGWVSVVRMSLLASDWPEARDRMRPTLQKLFKAPSPRAA